MTVETLSFKPRARLIRTIGDRLISGPETAVIELVKNSHDADASYAKVTIVPERRDKSGKVLSEGKIIVEDDGHGMTFNEIEERWMEPATTDKVNRQRSPKNRPLLGSKGIGRFAAARLGNKLDLISSAETPPKSGKFQTTSIKGISWRTFDEVEYLSDVSFEAELEESDGPSGTVLLIKELREQWTEHGLTELNKELRRLISPLEEADRAEFSIYLNLSAFTKPQDGFDGSEIVNGPLPEAEKAPDSAEDTRELDLHRIRPFPLLRSCDYEVDGEFDSDGKFIGSITIHRGGLEPQKLEFDVPQQPGEEQCGLVLVNIFVFDRENDALKSAMRRAGLGDATAKQARSIVNDIAGVAIYRDKFRIRPYGDSDNDWLTLDNRRVNNPSLRIGHNQVSGILVISEEHISGLIERSSREGLEENGHYRRLKSLMEALFSEIEPVRFRFRSSAEIQRSQPTPIGKALAAAEMAWAQEYLASLPDQIRQEAEERFARESRALVGYLRRLEQAQAKLESQVTLGLIVGEVLHEGRGPVGYLFDQTRRLTRWWPILFEQSDEAQNAKQHIPAMLRHMNDQSEKLRDLFRALKPLAGGQRGKPRYYNPNQVVLDVFAVYESKLKLASIDKSLQDHSTGRDILGHKSDLSTAVTNLIDNAIFWLDREDVVDPKIEVVVSTRDSQCCIQLTDNGPGIPEEFRDNLFEVGFSLKPSGTGLGLSIAQEAIARSGGTMDFDNGESGASFTILIPYGD